MTGTFIDTIIVCTITGLTIASSGVLGTVGPDGEPLTGVALTMAAFSTHPAQRETGSFLSVSCSSPTPPFSAGNITAKRHGNISGAPIHTISSTALRFPFVVYGGDTDTRPRMEPVGYRQCAHGCSEPCLYAGSCPCH